MAVCDICQKPAVVHVSELEGDAADERHFCQQHAEAYLGADFYRDVAMPFNLTSLSRQAYERIARVMEDVELTAKSPLRSADLVPAVQGLIGLLNDDEACVRYLAAGWLGSIGGSEVLHALRAAAHDPNRHVRKAVRKAIEQIES